MLLLLALTGAAQDQLTDKLPVDPRLKVGKLANGLTYYIQKNSRPEKKVELRLVVNAGSILEESRRGNAYWHPKYLAVAIDYLPWTTVSHINRFVLERGMRFNQHVLSMLRAAHPKLRPHSNLFFAGLTKGSSFQTGDGPVVRWASKPWEKTSRQNGMSSPSGDWFWLCV